MNDPSNTGLRTDSHSQKDGGQLPDSLINAIACPIYYQSNDGICTGCNTTFADLIAGLPASDVIGTSMDKLNASFAADLALPDNEAELKELQQNGLQPLETSVLCSDGKTRRFAVHQSPIRNTQGRLVGSVGIMLDITTANTRLSKEIEERRQAQLDAKSNQERYRRIFETTGAATILVEADMTISMANAEAAKLAGMPREQIVGRAKSIDFVAPADRERLNLYHELRMQNDTNVPRRYEFQIKDSNGRVRDLMGCAEFIPETSQTVVSMLDVTHSNQMHKERQRLAAVIDQSTEAVVITDTHGKVEYVNQAFEDLSGYEQEVCTNQNIDGPFFSDQDRAIFNRMTFSVTDDDTWTERIENQRKNGQSYIADTRFFPVCDATGKAVNLVCVKRDVTHEVQLEKQLQHTQKLEAIGTLAGGIAHDFNNILGGILGYAEICQLKSGSNQQIQPYLGRILDGCQRAKELVANILTFSRKQDEEQKPIEVQTIVKEVMKLLRASIPSTVEFNLQICTEPSIVLATPSQIHQVIMNLCTNAAQAMPENGGEIGVSLENIELNEDDCKELSRVAPGPHVCLKVTDSGPGMPEVLMDRIFEPYFTTKNQTGGTGLGLSVVHGIIKNAGGTITVTSEPDHGSTFAVYLPLVPETVPTDLPEEEEIPRGDERILVVDDEHFILEIMSDMLQSAGYHAEIVSSSEEALQIFQDDPDRFDVVIADHTMPKIPGKLLAKEIKTLRPNMPVILSTGLAFDDDTLKDGLSDFAAVLKKPILYKDLATAVRQVVDAAKGNHDH